MARNVIRNPVFLIGLSSTEDLSNKKGFFVKRDVTGVRRVLLCSAQGEKALGVVYQGGTAGQGLTVQVFSPGSSYECAVLNTAALASGDKITPSATGQGEEAASGDNVVGEWWGGVRAAGTGTGTTLLEIDVPTMDFGAIA